VAQLKAVVGTCRNLRSEMGLNPGERVPLLTHGDSRLHDQATPLLKALARLAEVRVIDDEAAFAAATQAAPVAVQGQPGWRCTSRSTSPPRPSAWARKSPGWKARSSRPRPSWAMRASWPARRPPWWNRNARAWPTSRRRWTVFETS
jgi:hypothetical protein